MKHIFFFLTLSFTALSVQAQSSWFTNTSCSPHGTAIADEAFEALVNVERPMAIGMSKAALLIDEGCGIAKLVLASASGDSQQRLLDEAGAMSLSADEALWHGLLKMDQGCIQLWSCQGWQQAATEIVESGNESPAFAYQSAWDAERGTVAANMEAFVAEYPDHAASAYNILAYAYAQAGGGVEEVDMIKAMRYLYLYEQGHDGPNASDSRSEILWSAGERAGAWTAIRSAVDRGGNPSIYASREGVIWRAMNEADLATAIHEKVSTFWGVFLDAEGNKEAWAALLAPSSSHCNSNMEACYKATKVEQLGKLSAGPEWLSLEVSDVDVTFNSDYSTAVATHMNTGQYKTDDGSVVDYKARGSSVWSLDPLLGEWLLIHVNFAPSGGAGIPSTN
ncbi:MAG: nuclear transport factor 2 family protein [Proteobacteria bacterium]|nr:nuclear transport factor 2 family protein [Pseudomonadota bacterium]